MVRLVVRLVVRFDEQLVPRLVVENARRRGVHHLVLEHPGTGFGARATDLLRDALDELDELDTTRKD